MSVRETSSRVIAGRYRLIELLGKGGVGQVWRAHDEVLRREVAVKEVFFPAVLPEADRATMQARVLREARAAAALPHSSVVTVYDVMRDEVHGYIVMELVAACSIAELVQRDGPMTVEKVAAIATQVVDVLEVAHAHGIIHRDIKPGNVMVPPDGPVKLADFGIAWMKDDPKLTASGLLLGSPSFMAPEQAQGLQSTPASDMYGLGATMYYAVEGELPFDKGQPIATLTSVMMDPPRPPRRAAALAPLIRALLAKDPGARPVAAEVKSLLAPLLPGSSAPAAPATSALSGGKRTLVFDDLDPGLLLPGAAGRLSRPGPPAQATEEKVPGVIQAEMALGWGRPARWWDSTTARMLAVVLVAALAAGGIYLLSQIGDRSTTEPRTGTAAAKHQHRNRAGIQKGQPSAAATGAVASPSAPAVLSTPSSGSTSASGVVPAAGWVPYADSTVGWSIFYPPGWDPQQRDSHDIDFADPKGGRYLRVAWTTTPGPDPAAGWRKYSKSFGARFADYRTLDISDDFTFKGWTASAWEYTYSSDGTMLHAVDLGMVNGVYGFALNFQTHESDWLSSQSIFDAFKESFQPPS